MIFSTARDLKRVLQGAKYLLKLKYLMTLEMLRILLMLALKGLDCWGKFYPWTKAEGLDRHDGKNHE